MCVEESAVPPVRALELPYNRSVSNKQPKHVHPKILFINLDPTARDQLIAKGFNVQNGTYGIQYVAQTQRPEPILVNWWLPNFTEQEIIAVDLTPSADLWN